MSESLPFSKLPERPNLEHLRKQAKDLHAAGGYLTLTDAQFALATSYGFPSWPRLKLVVEQITLYRLIQDGDPEPVRALIESSPQLVTLPFDDGFMPLHVAAGENRPAIVEVLIGAGAPLDRKFGTSGHSALSWAVTCWAFGAAKRLVELGVKPDLFSAAGLGLLDDVKAFWPDGTLRPGPSTTGSSRASETGESLPAPPTADADQVSDALYIACRTGRVDVARWLIEHGADPNWRGFAGATCLAWAEFSGKAELTACLRDAGGSDDLVDYQYRSTPKAFGVMVLAGWGFHQLLVRRLTADPSLVSITGGIGTPLHAAADGGQAATVKVLLAFGADRSAKDAAGCTPADLALAKGHTALAEKLRASMT